MLLRFFYAFPVKKTVSVVDEKVGYANEVGQNADITNAGEPPNDDKKNIVCTKTQRVVRAAHGHKNGRRKARARSQRIEQKIARFACTHEDLRKILQEEIVDWV